MNRKARCQVHWQRRSAGGAAAGLQVPWQRFGTISLRSSRALCGARSSLRELRTQPAPAVARAMRRALLPPRAAHAARSGRRTHPPARAHPSAPFAIIHIRIETHSLHFSFNAKRRASSIYYLSVLTVSILKLTCKLLKSSMWQCWL